MVQDHHHKSGNGRYYKDKSRKYYQSPYNYSYSSYSSNPNPFPSNQQPQPQHQQHQQLRQQQQTQDNHHNEQQPSNPFSSRRADSSSNLASTQSSSNEPIKSDFNSSSSTWYNTPPKRNLSYRSARPSSILNNSGINSSVGNRRSTSDSYRDDQYSDYNNKYTSYSHHDHYSSGSHKNQSFNKSKYYNKHSISNANSTSVGNNNKKDYQDFSSFKPNFSQPASIPLVKKSLLESTTKAKKYGGKSNDAENKFKDLIETEVQNSDKNKYSFLTIQNADANANENENQNKNENENQNKNANANNDENANANNDENTNANNDENANANNDENANANENENENENENANANNDENENENANNDENGNKRVNYNKNIEMPDPEINNIKDSNNFDDFEKENQDDIHDHVEDVKGTLVSNNNLVDDDPTANKLDVNVLIKKPIESDKVESITPIDVSVNFNNDINEASNDNLNTPEIDHKTETEENLIKSKNNNHKHDKFSDVEECIFPMLEKQYRAWELKHTPKSIRRKNLKYLNKTRLTDISQYNFIDKSLLIFKQADSYILFNNLKNISSMVELKKKSLTDRYVYSNHLWKKDIKFYDKQLEKSYENEDNVKTLDDSISKSQQAQQKQQDQTLKTTTSRRSRHHGDSVRTEAEFMEILASLEQEREKDPLVRAQYGSAIIPDMIIDPIEKYALTRYMDSNNLVKDKESWATRIYTDPVDTFTEAEHNKFCELYAFHPKKFGRISRDMGGLRTSEECVLHYYKTKKTTNYKQLVSNRNKRPKRKLPKKKRDSKSKTETITPETSNIETDNPNQTNEDELNILNTNILNSNESEVVSSVLAQEHEPALTPNQSLPTDPTLSVESEPKYFGHKRKISVDDGNSNNKQRKTSEANISQGLIIANEPIEHGPQLSVSQNIPHPIMVENNLPPLYSHNEESHQSYLHEESKRIKRGKKKDEEKHISSYWSVQDINVFPTLLQTFGSSWEEIAQRLGTKSATMVKNFYRRGLVEHPEWQTFIHLQDQTTQDQPQEILSQLPQQPHLQMTSQPQEIIKPVEQSQNIINQNGPSMGYFYKPTNTHPSTYSKSSLIPSNQYSQLNRQHQQQMILEDNRYIQNVPQFVPIDQSAPHYRYYINEPYSNSHLAVPQPPIQIPGPGPTPVQIQVPNTLPQPGRNTIMNMTSLLNSSNNGNVSLPSIQSNFEASLVLQGSKVDDQPAPIIKTESMIGKRQNIMNLLNDDTANVNKDPTYRRTSPFKPNISNIMNSSPVQIKNENDAVPSVYQAEPLDSRQLQKEQKPSFIGGTSALDALAQIAFERK